MRRPVLLVAFMLTLAGCGDDPPREVAAPAPAESFEHVHGLGVDGGDLYIATHHGLWRAAGQTAPELVGTHRHDLMGFTVATDGRFLASGHPDPEAGDLPPVLGLMTSDDQGVTWEPVSLTGEADFHVLRVSGRRVYGIDSGSGELFASADGGRSWERRRPPPGTYDLVISPADPDELLAATQQGLARSRDGGRTWRAHGSGQVGGLLAWPTAATLYAVDGQGTVLRSDDAGREWETAGSLGGPPEALIADGARLYAAVAGGRVLESADGGATWSVRAGA